MKKRLIAIMLCLGMSSASLAGCSGGNQASNEYVTVAGYKGIEIDDIDEPEVTDEEVDTYINSLLVGYSTQEVKAGDVVNIDYVGVMDGEQFDGGSSQGVDLEIGSNTFIPGFEDSIVGHKAGDTFDFNGKFPDDYRIEDLKGRDVVFTITVNHINGDVDVPELDDELVATLSDSAKTVDAYKKEIKKQLEENKQSDYESQLQSLAWDAVLEKAEIEKYPEDKLEEYSSMMMDQYESYAKDCDMELEEMLQSFYQMSLDDFKEQVDTAAKESIKQELVAEAIAKAEKLEPTDKELDEEFEKLAKDYGYADVDALREVADDDTLRSIVIQNRVREFLGKNAIQVKE